MNTTNKAILETIAKEQQISDKTEEKLKTIISNYTKSFAVE